MKSVPEPVDELTTRDFWHDVRELGRRIESYRTRGTQDDIFDDEARYLAERIERGAQSAGSPGSTTADSARCLNAYYLLGWWHYLRFEHHPLSSSDVGELARAIVYFSAFAFEERTIPADLLTMLPGERADPAVQISVATGLLRSVVDNGDEDGAVVEAAMVLCSSVGESTPSQEMALSGLLAVAYRMRFQHAADGDEDPDDLHQAIEGGELLVAALPSDDPDHVLCAGNLSVAYRLRFEADGEWEDLRRAIELGESATNVPHASRADLLADLAVAYWGAYEHTGQPSYLRLCVRSGDEALAGLPEDKALLIALGVPLRHAHEALYRAGGDPAELADSIEVGLRVAEAVPPRWPELAVFLSQLSMDCWSLFDHTGADGDRQRAVEVTGRAVQVAPMDEESPDSVLMRLYLDARTQPDSRSESLVSDRLMESAERAVTLLTGPTLPDNILTWLAEAYGERMRRRGDTADMNRAIELGEQILTIHPSRKTRAELATAYEWRFRHTGVATDLQSALRHSDLTLTGLPANHPHRVELLSQIAAVHLTASVHGHPRSRLDTAIDLLEQVLRDAASTLTDRNRAAVMSNLAGALLLRAQLTRSLEDLGSARSLAEQALHLLPDDPRARSRVLSVLGLVWHARFDLTGDPSDLREALQAGERALTGEADTAADPSSMQRLSNLAHAYRDLFDIAPGDVAPGRLAALAEQWSSLPVGEPAERVYAASAIGSLAHATGDQHTATALLDAAVALLPTIVPHDNGWQDNEPRLRGHFRLAEEAIAAHIALPDLRGAVEIGEASRGLLLASALDTRSDLTELASSQPGLAREFVRLREEFDTAGRADSWAAYQRLLDRIRAVPGCEHFLQPPRFTELRSAVDGGVGVLINAGKCRSDAIIVTSDAEPIVVSLPGLRSGDVLSRAMTLLTHTDDPGSLAGALRRRRVLNDTLAWLWTTTVEHVFTALGPHGPEPHRVWWIPTGLLGLFPWHAAGLPSEPGSLDLAVSSQVPTLRVLAHARSRPPADSRRQLTVALGRTPGLPGLPGTVLEAASLHASWPGQVTLADSAATIAAVRAALPAATWAHFACHAVCDLTAPANSAIHLHDGALTIPDIGGLRLPSAELAYLSACSTADGGLAINESINLASAFHLAGFRHVIAALWPLDDSVAARAAGAFYGHLPDATADDAALALHRVCHDLRSRYPDRPDLWAALVHSGP
ncbi:CHAT domain-containing protein [Streptomyces sp. H39-S7]|uniref:CHAT domain-containing protein n=1 Tax=Streptomyces sp. H39-S7 TaxID=3004357 RepID=UPI0022AE64BA|nr:CHAT domain-containing protein [Streptomyces sp. H39-S7]MCZ4125701.1 CHAT domain-containing protein [Streptomyces sp. H39-S7]